MIHSCNPVQADDQWQPVCNVNWEYRGTYMLTAVGGIGIIVTLCVVVHG